MMRRGIVVEVHPQDHSVDIVMADDGSRLVGVQVLTPNGSTRTGLTDLPQIPPRSDKWDVSNQTGQDMLAMVGYFSGLPVVVGFLYPQVNQMTHNDPKLRMERHQSDVITTVDGIGNIQLAHPSGLFLKIGDAPEKIDYTAQNADANSAVDRNTDTAPYVRLYMRDGMAILTIAPTGAITLTTESTIDVHAKDSITVVTDTTMTLKSIGEMKIESDSHIKMTAPRIDIN